MNVTIMLETLSSLQLLAEREDLVSTYLPKAEDQKELLANLQSDFELIKNMLLELEQENILSFFPSPSNIMSNQLVPQKSIYNIIAVMNDVMADHGLIVGQINDLKMSSLFTSYIALYEESKKYIRENILSKGYDYTDEEKLVLFADTVANRAKEALSKVKDVAVGIASYLKLPATIIGAAVGITAIYFISKSFLPKEKENPLLMLVNPPKDTEKLHKDVQKKLGSKIDKHKFELALKNYYEQHHRYPDLDDISDIPGNMDVAIEIGKVKEIIYEPPKKSRKCPFRYEHKMANTKLVSDSTGNILQLVGDTKLQNGWLVN